MVCKLSESKLVGCFCRLLVGLVDGKSHLTPDIVRLRERYAMLNGASEVSEETMN